MRSVGAALNRPRLWRITAMVSALLLCGLLVGAAQGSITVLGQRPAPVTSTREPSWERRCADGQARWDRQRLAYCARVDGIVVATTHGPGPGEVHVAVVGGFHLTLVRLADGSHAPSFGSRVVAVGPLVRARNGQREVQAFWVQR
jgi:hypothetical protein